MPGKPDEKKPQRLYFKTYLQVLSNSVGTQMFRNFYIRTADGAEMDALSDGSNSCAFYVSSVLALSGKLSSPHGTVKSTLADLEHSGWNTVEPDSMRPGDVLLWEPMQVDGGWFEHLGFYLGDNRAVSTSWTEKKVVEHDAHFDGKRAIKRIFRTQWK